MGAFWTTHDESRPGQHSFDSRQLPHDTWFTCVAKRNKVRTPKTNAGCDDIVGGRMRQTLNCTVCCSQAALPAWCLSDWSGLSNSSYLADTTRKGGKTCARTATTARLSVIVHHGHKRKVFTTLHPRPLSLILHSIPVLNDSKVFQIPYTNRREQTSSTDWSCEFHECWQWRDCTSRTPTPHLFNNKVPLL